MPQVPLSRLRTGDECVIGANRWRHIKPVPDSGFIVLRCGNIRTAASMDELVTVTDELFVEIQRRENEHP